jgi:hypothetical protein
MSKSNADKNQKKDECEKLKKPKKVEYGVERNLKLQSEIKTSADYVAWLVEQY